LHHFHLELLYEKKQHHLPPNFWHFLLENTGLHTLGIDTNRTTLAIDLRPLFELKFPSLRFLTIGSFASFANGPGARDYPLFEQFLLAHPNLTNIRYLETLKDLPSEFAPGLSTFCGPINSAISILDKRSLERLDLIYALYSQLPSEVNVNVDPVRVKLGNVKEFTVMFHNAVSVYENMTAMLTIFPLLETCDISFMLRGRIVFIWVRLLARSIPLLLAT
jgi:hypothetical protein